MKTLFILTTSHGGHLYALFYMAAFLVTAGIFIYQGFRHHYPKRTWLVITLFGIMCCVIGCKVIMVDPFDWKQLLHGQSLPDTGRSVLGGILGLIIGLLIAKRWLNFNRPVLDRLAYALPLGMAINRMGCLFGGCCHGTTTHMPWGVQYGMGSRAFDLHAETMQIPSNCTLSLPVHPTQAYDILFCLIVLLLVWLTRKYWKAPGSRFLFTVIGYASFRFIEEFVRQAPLNDPMGETILGLKRVQWFILIAIIIMTMVLILRELTTRKKPGHVNDLHPVSLHREFLLFSTIPVLLVMTSGWLDPFEKHVTWIFMIPLALIFIHSYYSRLMVPQLQWKLPVILIIAGIAMSQVSIEQQEKPVQNKYKGWLSIDAFGGLGSYGEKLFDCEGNVTDVIKRDYSTWGAGMTYHYKPLENHHLKTSINFYSSSDQTEEQGYTDYKTPAFNFTVSYNIKYVGGTLGMNVFFDEYWISDVVPVADIWVGQQDILFAETRFMTDYHFLGPPGLLQVGVGSGFGQVDKSIGRAGVTLMETWDLFGDKAYALGGYFAGDILVKDRATIRGNLFIGKYIGGSLGVQIHLGNDRWTSRVKN